MRTMRMPMRVRMPMRAWVRMPLPPVLTQQCCSGRCADKELKKATPVGGLTASTISELKFGGRRSSREVREACFGPMLIWRKVVSLQARL